MRKISYLKVDLKKMTHASNEHSHKTENSQRITKTCLYNFDPFKPLLLYSKTGV